MEKILTDERNGWEYELIGEPYYPTGRVMRDGRLQPETVDADDGPKKETIIDVRGNNRQNSIIRYRSCSRQSIHRKTAVYRISKRIHRDVNEKDAADILTRISYHQLPDVCMTAPGTTP